MLDGWGLHGWDNFLMTAGAAAATLIGLLFVAITLGADLSTPNVAEGTRAFLTPTIFQFSAVLFQCLALLAPWPSAWAAGIILGLWGLAGLVYQVAVFLMLRKTESATLDWIDFALFSAVAALSHASLIAGAGGLIAGNSFAPYAIAGAITVLLLTGIRGAWVVTLWIATNRGKTKT
jgi:hypothetical protein